MPNVVPADASARPASRRARPVVASFAALLTAACTHTYVYGESVAPIIERGALVVPTSSGDDTFRIRRIGVATIDDPFGFRPPNSDELAEIHAGVMPDGVHTVRIDVNNSGTIWRDWGLAAFGIGASLVMAAVGVTAVIEPGGVETGLTLPLAMLFAALTGTEFMLIGVGIGVGFESGTTDLRYRRFGDD